METVIIWWHISAIHIIFGQHNISCQVKIAISSNQIESRQVKIMRHVFFGDTYFNTTTINVNWGNSYTFLAYSVNYHTKMKIFYKLHIAGKKKVKLQNTV
jgi:hypothetical protein